MQQQLEGKESAMAVWLEAYLLGLEAEGPVTAWSTRAQLYSAPITSQMFPCLFPQPRSSVLNVTSTLQLPLFLLPPLRANPGR